MLWAFLIALGRADWPTNPLTVVRRDVPFIKFIVFLMCDTQHTTSTDKTTDTIYQDNH